MFRNYFHLCEQLRKTVLNLNHLNQNTVLKIRNSEIEVIKRWAGHSKWSNIKHTKAAMDHAKSVATMKMITRIEKAIKMGGPNPDNNAQLKALIEESKKKNISGASIEKCIKRAVERKDEKPFWTVFSGPHNIVIGFEIHSGSVRNAQTKLTPFMKKINFRFEKNLNDVCTERGIVVCDPLDKVENSLDKAIEDGIEIGAEEVESDNDNMLYFQCFPHMVDVIETKLEAKGYTIVSGTTELEFAQYVDVTEEDLNTINGVVDKINKNLDLIERVAVNVKTD